MRITAREAKELSDNKYPELLVVCQRIKADATAGFTQNVFSKLRQETKNWLESNGYELKDEGEFTTVSWLTPSDQNLP
jgi:hypothetical protein